MQDTLGPCVHPKTRRNPEPRFISECGGSAQRSLRSANVVRLRGVVSNEKTRCLGQVAASRLLGCCCGDSLSGRWPQASLCRPPLRSLRNGPLLPGGQLCAHRGFDQIAVLGRRGRSVTAREPIHACPAAPESRDCGGSEGKTSRGLKMGNSHFPNLALHDCLDLNEPITQASLSVVLGKGSSAGVTGGVRRRPTAPGGICCCGLVVSSSCPIVNRKGTR